MIKNNRQYRITAAQVRAFEQALKNIESAKSPPGVDPQMVDVQKRALQSQYDDLCAELEEYEALKRGDVAVFETDDLTQLPLTLIKSRIALNLTQKDLADRIGVKEQQVQRWEATNYGGASLETLQNVIRSLGLGIRKEVLVPHERLSSRPFVDYLEGAGIPKELLKRILPSQLAAKFSNGHTEPDPRELIDAAARVARVFKTDIRDLLDMKPVNLLGSMVSSPRFKRLSKNKPELLNAYIVYVHYLAATVESCAADVIKDTLTADYRQVHARLTKPGVPMTFLAALQFAWDCGVLVIPLRQSGLFHGAIWKIRGRPVVILKQTTSLESRWLYDLLHELGHAAKKHVTDDVAVIEEDPISPDLHGREEEQANKWAEDVIFGSKSNEIEDACVKACGRSLRKLKNVVPKIAARFNVNVGALANHMAHRLASEGQNWWGAANNLQHSRADPFDLARTVLFQRIKLSKLSPVDHELVIRALADN